MDAKLGPICIISALFLVISSRNLHHFNDFRPRFASFWPNFRLRFASIRSRESISKFLGSQNCLLEEKMALKKALPDRKLCLKYHYQTGIWPQIALLDGNFALKYNYLTRIRLLRPVMIFESPIPVWLCLLRAKLLSGNVFLRGIFSSGKQF